RHTRFSRDWSSDVCSSDLPTTNRLTADRSATELPPNAAGRERPRGSGSKPTKAPAGGTSAGPPEAGNAGSDGPREVPDRRWRAADRESVGEGQRGTRARGS